MTKPAYSQCTIYYDGRAVSVGDFLRTPGGSAYRIQKITQSRTRQQRRNLVCLRWPVDEIPADATVHPLHWYARKKKRATTLQQMASRAA